MAKPPTPHATAVKLSRVLDRCGAEVAKILKDRGCTEAMFVLVVANPTKPLGPGYDGPAVADVLYASNCINQDVVAQMLEGLQGHIRTAVQMHPDAH